MTPQCEADLRDVWQLYFHDPNDKSWTHSSYTMISAVYSPGDAAALLDRTRGLVTNGMFFLMREHVFPAWDDPGNLEGGCLCLRIPKDAVSDFWRHACGALLGETLVKEQYEEHASEVNGISVSPKKNFCIVKIWLASRSLVISESPESACEAFNLPPFEGGGIYKPNMDETAKFVSQNI